MFRLPILIVATVAVAPALRAQEPEIDVAELLRELRKPGLNAVERERLSQKLIDTGTNGAGQVFHLAQLRFRKLHKEFLSARTAHLKKFRRAALVALQRKQGRGGAAEIDTLRAKVLSHSRGRKGVDKAVIRSVLDPAMKRLAQLCEISAVDVLAADPKVRLSAEDIDRRIEELQDWLAIYDLAGDAFAESDHGARVVDRAKELPNPYKYGQELRSTCQRLAFDVTPMSESDRKTLDRNTKLAPEIDELEAEGVRLLNRLRIHLGIGALLIDTKLCTAGRDHSKDMRRLGFFSHTSPVPGKETPGKRAALAGTSGGAENIAWGQGTAQGVIRAWWYSPGHHRNMLGGHRRIGLGRSESHWTQMFGG